MQNFTTSFMVNKTPHEAFEAITNVRGWWSKTLEGASKQQGDEFIYRHKDLHYSKHLLTEVIPDQKVVWLTTESSINFVDDRTEWNDTTVIFEVKEVDGQTIVEFTHQGLTPELACFDACSGGWTYYLQSLHNLIDTGVGHPDEA